MAEREALVASDRGLTATFIGLWATVFCSFLALGAVLPVLPRYVRGPVHAGDLAVAIVVTASSFAALLVRPFARDLAEARGQRRVMLVGAALIAIVAGAGRRAPAPRAGRGPRCGPGAGQRRLRDAGGVHRAPPGSRGRRQRRRPVRDLRRRVRGHPLRAGPPARPSRPAPRSAVR